MGWQPELARELSPVQLDACLLSAISVPPPWPALGMPHHLPRPQEPFCGAHPRDLCRLGGMGTGWAVSTLAASLAGDPQCQERGLQGRLNAEQQ